VFDRFDELGSVHRVWLWLRSEGLSSPLQAHYGSSIRWVDPSYIAIYHVLTNPVYAGAYAYGKSRCEGSIAAAGPQQFKGTGSSSTHLGAFTSRRRATVVSGASDIHPGHGPREEPLGQSTQILDRGRYAGEHHLNLPADEIGERPAVRHIN
jgi:hypothetical protein